MSGVVMRRAMELWIEGDDYGDAYNLTPAEMAQHLKENDANQSGGISYDLTKTAMSEVVKQAAQELGLPILGNKGVTKKAFLNKLKEIRKVRSSP